MSTPIGHSGARFWRWNSPLPYLFGGLAAMLLLIAISLIVLVCSYLKSSSSSNNDGEDIEKPVKVPHVLPPAEIEPKIVVIMAGDENPRFIAEPIKLINCSSSASTTSHHHYNNNNHNHNNQQEEV